VNCGTTRVRTVDWMPVGAYGTVTCLSKFTIISDKLL